MKITFLGSSHGIPEPNRRCSCTLLEVGTHKYFIDMGMQAIESLITMGIRPEAIDAVFLTHMHGDHSNGLISFVDLISWAFKDADPRIFLPDVSAAEIMKNWCAVCESGMREDLRFAPVEEGLLFDDGTIRVTAVRTHHCKRSFGYQIEAEGKKLAFTGDMQVTEGPVTDYPRIVDGEGYDLAVCECAHFEAVQYLPAFKRNPPKHILFNHYSQRFLGSVLKTIEEMKDITDIRAVTDNYSIEI